MLVAVPNHAGATRFDAPIPGFRIDCQALFRDALAKAGDTV
jgi:hypothetical protein